MFLKPAALATVLLLAAAAQTAPVFTDVTLNSGIPYLKHAEGVAVSDLDGDGLPELYLPNVKGPDRLFRNNGGLKFSDITDKSGISHDGGIGAVVFDLDGDGRKDVYAVRGAYPYGLNVMYAGGDGGRFEDVSEEAGVLSRKNGIFCVLGDYDLDGDQDVFVVNWGRDTLYRNVSKPGLLLFEDATEEAGLASEGRSWSAVMSDFDADGRADIFVGQGGPGTADRSKLYINRGADFEDATNESGLNGISAMGAVSCDFDCDGDQDLFITCFEGPDRLFLNNGKAVFTDVTTGSGIATSRSVGAAAGCVDGDLLPDLVVAGFAGPARLFKNLGDGKFADMGKTSGLGPQKRNEGAALGDLDGDGDLDLYVASYDGHNALYKNNLDSGPFIKVRPRFGGREAVGAKVMLYEKGGLGKPEALLAGQETQAGFGFCSQAETEALFRLPGKGPFDMRVVFPRNIIVDRKGVVQGTYEIHCPVAEPGKDTPIDKSGPGLSDDKSRAADTR